MIYLNKYPYCVLRSPEDEGGGGGDDDGGVMDPAGEDTEGGGGVIDPYQGEVAAFSGQRVASTQIPPEPPRSDLPTGAISWVWIVTVWKDDLGKPRKKGEWKPKFPPKVKIKSDESGVSTTEVNPLDNTDNPLYNTISCPCSSYAIISSNGDVGCERDYFGEKQFVSSTPIKNHFIDGNTPKVGDTWRCTKMKCEQGNFKWDTLHVVKVEENKTDISSSLFNSIASTSNCYIPPTTLKDYAEKAVIYREEDFMEIAESRPDFARKSGFNINNPIDYIDGKPLFETKDQTWWYNTIDKSQNNLELFTEYNKGDISGYLPGIHIGEEKVITDVSINKHASLFHKEKETVFDSDATVGKPMLKSVGDTVVVKIKGINNPQFTWSLDDSSGCSVLKRKMKDIICKGTYIFEQQIPALPSGKSSEIYTFKLTPSAETKFYTDNEHHPFTYVIKAKLYQYANPTNTLTVSNSTIANQTTTSTNITFSGDATSYIRTTSGFTSQTHTTTIARDSGTDLYYIKKSPLILGELVTKNNVIKKTIVREDLTDTSYINDILVVGDGTSDGTTVSYRGDVKEGMTYSTSVSKTKTVRKSIDLDAHLKEPCDECDKELDIFTNRFEVDDTIDIYEGMIVDGKSPYGRDFSTILKSVDCGRSITLETHHAIDNGTDLTFKDYVSGVVGRVQDVGKGKIISLSSSVRLKHGTEITFENGHNSVIGGQILYSKSGDSNITITTTVKQVSYGQEDVTFTLDMDDFVTKTPNACDQYLTVAKDSNININFIACDYDFNKYDKTVTITGNPSHGAVSAVGGDHTYYFTYTPHPNFKGKDKIKFTVSDGVNASDEKIIYLTVR